MERPSQESAGSSAWDSQYEARVAQAIKNNLREGDTFWDIGANVGWFTLLAAEIVGRRGKVHSFEPSPDVFAALRGNVHGFRQIQAICCGIGNSDGQFNFAAQGMSTAASFVEEVTKINQGHWPETAIRQVIVRMRKADTVVRQFGPAPSLIKIDVEGFELEVLKGAAGMLGRFRPGLIIEVHPPQLRICGGSDALLLQHLERCGYGWEEFERSDNSLYWLLAKCKREWSGGARRAKPLL